VGGNIGYPLTERLLESSRPDVAVLELSSFQLELFGPDYQGASVAERLAPALRRISTDGWSPDVAAITNITPNHLDRHASMAEYVRAKANILAFQSAGDWAVLNLDDVHTRAMHPSGGVLWFSLQGPVERGAYLREDDLILRDGAREQVLCSRSDVRLRGRHNLANVLAAACCGLAREVSAEAMADAIAHFTGVAHRLEVVRQIRGVTWVNDSIATSPERAIAALRAFDEPLVLLAGGRDKHLAWDAWADLSAERVRAVVAFGEAVPIIERALAEALARREGGGATSPALHSVATMDEAVAAADRLARPGDVVLLSPGGTSFDAFEDYEARGQRFRELIDQLG
jgi:UDP-N-acetylmuramoylalanine--D-glutamate ligase